MIFKVPVKGVRKVKFQIWNYSVVRSDEIAQKSKYLLSPPYYAFRSLFHGTFSKENMQCEEKIAKLHEHSNLKCLIFGHICD